MPKSTLAICAALAALTWMLPAAAQQNLPVATAQTQNIKRIPLQRFEVPGTSYETVIGIAEIGPNVSIGRHTHPGPESGYVIEGGFELLVEGEPPPGAQGR
jgi:quercetin dioxygenase-like cupin family protein